MNIFNQIVLLTCAATLAWSGRGASAQAADATPLQATVSIDAAHTLRTMDPPRLGGTNVAMWYKPDVYASPLIRRWLVEMRPRYIRLPGGSWANGVYWNGNGVRDKDGKVDPSRVGADGYPAVDYSAYAPSFLVNDKDLHPASNGWHGNVDVKTIQDFIKAMPGIEPLVCPNLGTGRPIDAAEWVKWDNQTMGYDCRYWELGNEMGGSWEYGTQLPFGKGQITPEMYTTRFNAMADAMRAVDPTIKIGGGAFAEEMIRDCGKNVDFVMIHTYPGSATQTDAQMFADIGPGIGKQVAEVRNWIHKYQPAREKQIEIAYTEWNLAGGVGAEHMFAGLWSEIFLGELATHGVSFATQWDCFSSMIYLTDHGDYARKPEYDALWLWNNYMGDRLVPVKSDRSDIYSYASRSDEAVSVILVNTDHERPAIVHVQLAGFTPAGTGELATFTSCEYYWNDSAKRPQWSTGAHVEKLATGQSFEVTLAPFSMTCVRVPDQAHPALTLLAQKVLATPPAAATTAQLRFVVPDEVYAGDQVKGDLLALAAGSDQPYAGTLAPATLAADAHAELDRQQVRLADDVGHFSFKAMQPGELTLRATAGNITASHTIKVKASVPRPIVFWDFANPPITDHDLFKSDYDLHADETERANRAVARIDLPADGATPTDQHGGLLKIDHLPGPDKLDKSNIRGLIVDVKAAQITSADPNASILVVMQSPANWWMKLGTIPLKDATAWKTYQFDVKDENYIKAMPSAMNIIFVLQSSKPVAGSVYIDKVGFMVR